MNDEEIVCLLCNGTGRVSRPNLATYYHNSVVTHIPSSIDIKVTITNNRDNL